MSWKRIEMVPWFRPPVDTQLATPGSLGETTIVYVLPAGSSATAWTLFRLVCSFQ